MTVVIFKAWGLWQIMKVIFGHIIVLAIGSQFLLKVWNKARTAWLNPLFLYPRNMGVLMEEIYLFKIARPFGDCVLIGL